jgi:hypothetical protein
MASTPERSKLKAEAPAGCDEHQTAAEQHSASPHLKNWKEVLLMNEGE